MKVKVWGARGSVPAPGPQMNRYGGNTSCVQVSLASGEQLILDAGTGIRDARPRACTGRERIHILLTHLHLDHIQGLMFFPPCFRAESEIVDLGAVLAGGVARGPDRALHLGPALAGRGPRAALLGLVSRHARERMGARRRDDPRRGGHPPRSDARLPDHRRRDDARLHPRPRAGSRRAAGRPRAGMDLGLRPRPRRRPADPRLPVHRRGVPRAHRLGSFRALGHAHVRSPSRGPRGCCSSITIRFTPTSSSTSSARSARDALGGPWRGDQAALELGAWRAPSSRSAGRSPPSTPESRRHSTAGTRAGVELSTSG